MADAAVASDGFGAAARWGARLLKTFGAYYAAEGERRLLWLPVFFGAGIAVYFALTFEPPLWLGFCATCVAGGAAFALHKRPLLCEGALAVTMFCAGFALIAETTWQRQTPMLQRRLGPVTITGRVVDIDSVDRGWRMVVAPDPLPGIEPGEQPARLRLHVAATSDPLLPGDRIEVRAALYPVPGQILPGSHDMQREAYFARIGGVGYSYGPAHLVVSERDDSGGGWREDLRHLRTQMSRRIVDVLPGSTGGVASALITGKRGAISEHVKEAFRQSGLQHLLAIAGLHLGLVGGFVFFTVRAALALIPWIALRYPIKKIAAAVALCVLACYLMLSGAAIPTERAFVMNGLVFVAILIDRLRISMRICALAAAFVLAVEPESLVGVSFQMSFAAVVALIAVYETYGRRLGHWLHRPSWPGRMLGYAGAVVVTTVIVTVGTNPFSIYHFHQVALYSPLANVVAVPLSAVWTLPWGVVSCVLMPFGLERWALVPMGWGIDVTIYVAETVSALPGNVWPMPRLPAPGLALVALGGLWLCLWMQPWRRWGVVAIAAGLTGMALTRPPDIVIADLGRFLTVRSPDGAYWAAVNHGERIQAAFLSEETGLEMVPWPQTAVPGVLDCSGEACRYSVRGRNVAILAGTATPPVDCAGVDAIVSQALAGFRCRSVIPVVDRIDSWRLGAVALWLDEAGIVMESANGSRGDRPWVPHPRPRHRP
ncbi:MAG: ComEC/Rec2 family competence protein [Alphaproteobacteria bacterium]|nr:ComEC/Rec2 family competence protein [Alphaproteobacteria bacterium]